MKHLLLVLLVVVVGCGDDNNLTDIPFVQGKIGGEEWNFLYGKAFRDVREGTFDISLYSDMEVVASACGVATTNNAHMTLTIPISEMNFNLPNNGESLSFEQKGSTQSFLATSGFVEITQILGNQVSGFVQAQFDDNNIVEGRFRLEICN